MANYLDIRPAADGPACLQLTQSDTAGGGIANADHTLLLLAWDSEEETDINYARCIHGPSPFGDSPLTDCWATITTTGTNDTITATWTAPKRKPHHYTMYRIAGTSYTRGTSAVSKILPIASERVEGNIPGYATSATFYSITSTAEIRDVEIDSVDAVNDTYTVRGNYILSAYNGAIVNQNDGGGNQTIDAVPTLTYGPNGVQTVISVSTAVNTSATRLRIITSNIIWPASTYSIFKVTISPTTDFALTPIDRTTPDINGRRVKRSLLNNTPFATADIAGVYGQTSISWSGNNQALSGTMAQGAGVYQLHEWAKGNIPVEVVATSDTDVVRAYELLSGYILPANDTGLRNTHNNSDIRFTLLVDGYRDSNNHFVWYDIAGSDNTAADSFDITGDYTSVFYAGRLFYVRDSASNTNDGLYAVSSANGSVYDSSTHVTRVYVTGVVTTDASATGRIELWD